MQRRFAWITAAGLGLGLVQVTLAGHLSVLHSQANAVVLALVLWSLLTVDDGSVWYGIIPSGLVLDLFSPLRFGFVTLTLCVLVFLLHQMHQHFIHYTTVSIITVSCFMAMILYDFAAISFAGLLGRVPPALVLGDGVYTAVLGLIILVGLLTFERTILGTDSKVLKQRGSP